jgi:hypothetical protein
LPGREGGCRLRNRVLGGRGMGHNSV